MSTWVFLRGLTRDSRHWGDFPRHFHAVLPDADVVPLDLPGNGGANRLRSPADVAAMAAWCRAELAARGFLPPYHLLAMSLGAMVAVAWAERHPGELRGCVLINASFGRFSPLRQRLRPQSWVPLLSLALPGRSDRAREGVILRLTSRLAADRPRIVETWAAWRRERPVARLDALRQLWAAARYAAPARKPAVPMLILAGAGDTLVDPQCSREAARCWQAAYAEHPAAGHDIPLDDGPWVARQVRAWLQREGESAGQSARR